MEAGSGNNRTACMEGGSVTGLARIELWWHVVLLGLYMLHIWCTLTLGLNTFFL